MVIEKSSQIAVNGLCVTVIKKPLTPPLLPFQRQESWFGAMLRRARRA